MKLLVILLFTATLFCPVNGQAQSRALKKIIELKMPKNAGDDFCGTRGGSVSWNPITKKYYAGFAGNAGFPLGVFDMNGKRLSYDELTTKMDIRGLWYDANSKRICGNGFGEAGWFSYTLDKTGIPADLTIDHLGNNQPDDNSAGTFNSGKNEVLFLKNDEVSFYNSEAANERTLTLALAANNSESNSGEQGTNNPESVYNSTALIYTGIPGGELGVLNTTKKQIELYSYEKGIKGKILTLPEDAPLEKSFNFAFSNGIYWLFDISNRTWLGYK